VPRLCRRGAVATVHRERSTIPTKLGSSGRGSRMERQRSVWINRELPGHEQERRFVNEFVSEVQRFIDFLLACEGFRIQ